MTNCGIFKRDINGWTSVHSSFITMMLFLLLTTAAGVVGLLCSVDALDVVEVEQNGSRTILEGPPSKINSNSLNGLTDVILKAYRSCSDQEAMLCVKKKTLNLLDILSKERSLPLISDTLFLVRDNEANETTMEDNTVGERSLADSFNKFFNNYSFQVKLPKFTFLQTIEEGRKKNKGYGGIGLMMGGSILAMGMAALAALAGKALAASMAALMMAAMAALKKGGGGGGGHSSYEVITVPGHHHRSFYEEETASAADDEMLQHHHDGMYQQKQHDDVGMIGQHHQQQQHHHHLNDHSIHYETMPYHYEPHEHTSSELHEASASTTHHLLHDAHLRDHHLRDHHMHT